MGGGGEGVGGGVNGSRQLEHGLLSQALAHAREGRARIRYEGGTLESSAHADDHADDPLALALIDAEERALLALLRAYTEVPMTTPTTPHDPRPFPPLFRLCRQPPTPPPHPPDPLPPDPPGWWPCGEAQAAQRGISPMPRRTEGGGGGAGGWLMRRLMSSGTHEYDWAGQ